MQNFHEFNYTPNGLSITNVKDVFEFSEREIVLGLNEGGLKLFGKDFKLTEVDLEHGTLKATGTLYSLNYGSQSKEGLLKKLFK